VKVYVLEVGWYDNRDIVGVYASAEAAMAAYPHGYWLQMDDGHWCNGLTHSRAAAVTPHEVQ
jgi:hypothetical protein